MPHVILVIAGSALMLFGFVMLCAWAAGRGGWFDSGVFDRKGTSKNDRQFLDLYFIAIVIGPLACGAILFLYGLRRWF